MRESKRTRGSVGIPLPGGRRAFLRRAACGFGYTALTALAQEQAAADAPAERVLTPRPGHRSARAKRVIFMFMQGGPSHVETFDYKPRLNADHGKPAPLTRDPRFFQPGMSDMRLFGSQWKFAQHGESGTWVSSLLPHIASTIDDVCVVNGMHADNEAHSPACLQMHTGAANQVRPSMGAWVLYGLGAENQNLPGFITINHMVSGDGGSRQQFGSGFLPAITQGTALELSKSVPGAAAKLNFLQNPRHSPALQRQQFDFVNRMNSAELARYEEDAQMQGMIESFELAFRMQAETPTLFDFAGETAHSKRLYGIGEPATDCFGRQCLLARRLAEAGVRFIQLNAGDWDHHDNIQEKLPRSAAEVDKPIAGLIADLKARGMFDETLLIWTGEFGRTPFEQRIVNRKRSGRGHNPFGFTTILAGGGVKGGMVYGGTDDYGYRAVQGKVHIHDLHATLLHLLGLDHERLTYRHAGRDFRLTDVYGRVIEEIVA